MYQCLTGLRLSKALEISKVSWYISTLKMRTYTRELNPQLHLSENLKTFTYIASVLAEQCLTQDDAKAVRFLCIRSLCMLHLSRDYASEAE
jgi:hypothetical protein